MNQTKSGVDADSLLSQNWSKFREQMPIAKKYAYFDHAAVAPLPQPAWDAIAQWTQEAATEGDICWPKWEKRVENIRTLAADLVNAQPGEIGLLNNTTTGIGHVAEGFPWEPGDNVVLPSGEFPSNVYPWKHLESRGVEVRIVEFPDEQLDLNRIAEACDARTRIVSLSWIGYASGYRIDPSEAARVAHDAGALLFLDAIQGVGVFPLDVKATDIDFFAADGHKWMLGPEGAGLFYCKREHLNLLRPKCVGWNSVEHRYDFSKHELVFRNETARYEGGSQNMIGFHGLGASLELLRDFGLGAKESDIAQRVLSVTDEMVSRLESIGATICSQRDSEHSSGIVSFEFPGQKPEPIRTKLIDSGVVLSVRHGRLRIAAHAYNNSDDIERTIGLLEACLAT